MPRQFCCVYELGRFTAMGALALCLASSSLAIAQTASPVVSAKPAATEHFRSRISIYDLRTRSVHVIYTADVLFEAPNWSSDGSYLLANSGGKLYRLELQPDGTARPHELALDPKYVCNNDKALAPNGKRLAFSAASGSSTGSQVFVADADGTHPRLLVAETPSYFHGWSPDGATLAFVAKRDENFDLFRIAAEGGPQVRMTRDAGHNDGPDYSPDGRSIYINSDRSGTEQIWRLDANGNEASRAERITEDGTQDWFPHPSPDGKWLVFLAFPREVEGHNARLKVQLRMQPILSSQGASRKSELLTTFFGGQGTINVNSWSPDSTRFAFVSYEPLP